MSPFQHVLVGTDFSEASEAALGEARRIAVANGARITLVHILDDDLLQEILKSGAAEEQELVGGAQRRLDLAASELADDSLEEVHAELAVGHPFGELLRMAKDRGADLLVLGTRGYGGDEEGRVGALASRCVRKAALPVLLVRSRQKEPFQHIVSCVDFSDNSKRAAELALSLARQDGATLELVHVNPASNLFLADQTSLMLASPAVAFPEVREALEKALEDLAEELSGEGDVPIETRVLDGAGITRTLASHLRESGADLAVLGTRGRRGLRSLLLGTTAEGVIHDAPCSVLAVKPEGFSYKEE